MRSADLFGTRLARVAALLALATAITGCSVMPTGLMGGRDTPDGASSGGASTNSAARRAPVKQGPPIDPLVQQSFDAAIKAQRDGRVADADRGWRALIAAHPELGGPHANLGLLFLRADKPAEAVAELETATRLSPQQPLYFNQLGIAYRQQGQFSKARTAYETAIELDPSYTAPILNLGILNDLYLADGARALALYNRYLAMVPAGDPAVVRWVADLKNRKPSQLADATRKEKP